MSRAARKRRGSGEADGSDQRKKVLVVAPTPFFSDRGCHIRIFEEANFLRKQGHEVLICTYHLGRDVGDFGIKRIPNFFWYRKLGVGPSWHKFYLDFFMTVEVWRAVRKFRPDIIHAHLHEGALIAIAARKFLLRKRPIVFDLQGSLVGEVRSHDFMRGSFFERVLAGLERYAFRKCDYTIASSRAGQEHVERAGFKAELVPDAIGDFEEVEEAARREREGIASESGEVGRAVDEGGRTIVYSGSLGVEKGIDILIRALARLRDRRVRLRVIGYSGAGRCRRLARELGVLDRVDFLGRVNYFDLMKYLAEADVACDPKLPDASEASGKILNYVGAGLPVVVFDTENNRDLAGEAGHFVADRTSEGLASGLDELIGDYELLRKKAAAARRLRKKRDWARNGQKLLRVYRKAEYAYE